MGAAQVRKKKPLTTGDKLDEKTHYRKAFNSPYLGSPDVVGEVVLTIEKVRLEPDKTKKTKDNFNTAYFVEREIRPGEELKPMILNATNSSTMRNITGSHYLEDWNNVRVSIYVDPNVKNRGQIVEGLRIRPAPQKRVITPENSQLWSNAKNAYTRDGNFNAVLLKADISEENQEKIISECESECKE